MAELVPDEEIGAMAGVTDPVAEKAELVPDEAEIGPMAVTDPVAMKAEVAPSWFCSCSSSLKERYMRWWLEDLPPVSGPLRFIFHVGLWCFFAANARSFFHLIDDYENTDPEMFSPRGILGFFGFGYIDPSILRAMISVTKVTWWCSAIGLFTRVSSAVTAIFAFFMHGYFSDISGGNRGFYVSTASLVVMCFSARRQDVWSVDYHLHKLLGSSQSAAQTSNYFSIRETGFARKCLLVYIVCFYVSSGLAKLYTSGFRWADGYTLQNHLKGHDNVYAHAMVDSRVLAVVSATGALFLEAGAFLALFRRLRVFFFIGWASMHIMIKLSMGRKYTQNVWCYILLVDWGAVYLFARSLCIKGALKILRCLTRRTADENLMDEAEALEARAREPPLRIGEIPGISRSSAKFATTIGTCLSALLAAQALFQIDWWPLTNVDMYSAYDHKNIKYSFPREMYDDAASAQMIANSWGNRLSKGELTRHVEIQLMTEGGKKKKIEPFGVTRAKQWRKSVFTKVLVEDFRTKPKGKIEFDPKHPENPASLFLLHVLPSLKRNVKDWKDYDYLVLTYKTDEPDPVIASVPLNDSELKRLEQTYKKFREEREGTSRNSVFVFLVCIAGLGTISYIIMGRIKASAKSSQPPDEAPMHDIETVSLVKS